MTLSSATHFILFKITAWWKDREDERLDELAALDYRDLRRTATCSGITTYQMVMRARSRRAGN